MRLLPLPFLIEEKPQAEPEPLFQYIDIPNHPIYVPNVTDENDEAPHIIIIDLMKDS
jgi:hypothetical protein